MKGWRRGQEKDEGAQRLRVKSVKGEIYGGRLSWGNRAPGQDKTGGREHKGGKSGAGSKGEKGKVCAVGCVREGRTVGSEGKAGGICVFCVCVCDGV